MNNTNKKDVSVADSLGFGKVWNPLVKICSYTVVQINILYMIFQYSSEYVKQDGIILHNYIIQNLCVKQEWSIYHNYIIHILLL